jgi:hypothetical protein
MIASTQWPVTRRRSVRSTSTPAEAHGVDADAERRGLEACGRSPAQTGASPCVSGRGSEESRGSDALGNPQGRKAPRCGSRRSHLTARAPCPQRLSPSFDAITGTTELGICSTFRPCLPAFSADPSISGRYSVVRANRRICRRFPVFNTPGFEHYVQRRCSVVPG